MPFDRLPGRLNHVPQLVQPYIPPPRPIVPYGAMITGAVDKIVGALDPVERAKRKATLAELSLTPQKIALERAQLARMTQLYSSGGMGGGNNPLDPTPQTYWNGNKYTTESPGQAIVRSKNAAAYHATESEANAHNAMVAKANAFAQAHQTSQYVAKPFPELNVPSGINVSGPSNDLSNATITPSEIPTIPSPNAPPRKSKEEEENEGG